MAKMMSARSRVKVRPWFYADYSGDYRARDRREARAEIDSCWEEIEDGRRLREVLELPLLVVPRLVRGPYSRQVRDP